jgi:hypothetical protein
VRLASKEYREVTRFIVNDWTNKITANKAPDATR